MVFDHHAGEPERPCCQQLSLCQSGAELCSAHRSRKQLTTASTELCMAAHDYNHAARQAWRDSTTLEDFKLSCESPILSAMT